MNGNPHCRACYAAIVPSFARGARQGNAGSAVTSPTRSAMQTGFTMVLIGGAITLGTYALASSSPGGGTYVVTYGLIVGGLARILGSGKPKRS